VRAYFVNAGRRAEDGPALSIEPFDGYNICEFLFPFK
jgi:hypothetical protein